MDGMTPPGSDPLAPESKIELNDESRDESTDQDSENDSVGTPVGNADVGSENNSKTIDTEQLPDVVVEVVSAGRVRPFYQRIDRFPFSIGRGYDNDLILADDTVSARHLVVEKDDTGFRLNNLSSENGTQKNKQTLSLGAVGFTLPTALCVGRTQLRFLAQDAVMAAAKPLAKLSAITEWCSSLRVALVLLLSYLAMNIYYALAVQSIWLDDKEVIVGQLIELVMPIAVATVTGFISHLLLHRWRFPLQLSIASILFLFLFLLDEFTNIVSYYFTDDKFASILDMGLVIAAFIFLLGWQLNVLSHLTRKKSLWIGGSIVLPLYGIFILQDVVGTPDFISQPSMHEILRASDIRTAISYTDIAEMRQVIDDELRTAMAADLEQATDTR